MITADMARKKTDKYNEEHSPINLTLKEIASFIETASGNGESNIEYEIAENLYYEIINDLETELTNLGYEVTRIYAYTIRIFNNELTNRIRISW